MFDQDTYDAVNEELVEESQSKATELKRQFPELTVTVVGSWIWIAGDTKPRAEELKKAGARFSRKSSRWYVMGLSKGRRKKALGYEYATGRYGEEEVAA